ncbi:hypothetical protein [Pseudomonas fluorescens]|nr:hypothetical protein [Pseudomonas fluorescens]
MSKRMRRDGAGRFSLPAGATGTINTLLSLGDRLEIYTEDCTVLSLSPNAIDPDRTNPDARWQNSILTNVGSSCPAIARTILMASEMLKQSIFEKEVDSVEVLLVVHSVKQNLVSLSLAVDGLVNEIKSERAEAKSSNFKLDPGGVALAFYPSVKDLDGRLTNILTLGKKVVVGVSSVFAKFGVTTRRHSRFDYLVKEVVGASGSSDWFKSYLTGALPGAERIGHLRDAQEHDEKHNLKLKNFYSCPDNGICGPVINLDNSAWVSLEGEVVQMVEFLINLVEVSFIGCLEQVLSKSYPYCFVSVESPPDIKPIRYRLTLDLPFSS